MRVGVADRGGLEAEDEVRVAVDRVLIGLQERSTDRSSWLAATMARVEPARW